MTIEAASLFDHVPMPMPCPCGGAHAHAAEVIRGGGAGLSCKSSLLAAHRTVAHEQHPVVQDLDHSVADLRELLLLLPLLVLLGAVRPAARTSRAAPVGTWRAEQSGKE